MLGDSEVWRPLEAKKVEAPCTHSGWVCGCSPHEVLPSRLGARIAVENSL